ncbi:MAG: rhamnogalacturonan lyase [Lachnospiraceae bacterium]|nr:rhamnogalacturonan lyase [Lachnospiraceae bacterium]
MKNEGETTETTSSVVEVEQKLEVTGLSVSNVKEDSVTIKWDACMDASVTGYAVYWADKDTDNMKYKEIARVDANTLSYTLEKATHVNHYFKVAAITEEGLTDTTEAVRSDTLAQFEVKLEKLDRGLVAATTAEGVFLSWRLLGDEVSGYSDTGLTGVNFNVYKNGTKVAYVEDSTNYLATGASVNDSFYVEAVSADGKVLNTSKDTIVCTTDNYIDIPIQKPADGHIDRTITIVTGVDENGEDIYYPADYTYSANDVSVGDVDGDGEYEYFVKWYPSNAQDVCNIGFTGNTYIDCYELDGTLLYRIDLGVNVRSGAHYTQFSVYDFNGDGKAEIAFQTAPGTKVIKYVDGDQTKGIESETYITIPAEDAANGVTNKDNYMIDAAQYREHLIGIFMDWGVWANDTEDMKAAKATWNKNIETLWGVAVSKQVAGHEGPYSREEAELLYDYFVDVYAPARSARNNLRCFEGYNLYGPEYLTVFAGETGAEMDTIPYPVDRADDGMLWGDYAMSRIEPGNRVDRFLSGMAFLDGENPYIILGRGYYTRSTVTALKLTAEGKLEQYWQIDSGWTIMNNPFYDGPHGINGTDEDAGAMTCQGNHQIMAADVDGDGCQEIIYGGAIVDNDGTLYSSGMGTMRNGSLAKYGHGDSLHITDIDPDRPGLEIFSCYEGGAGAPYGTALRDAETNEAIFGDYTGKDTGRCMIGDLDTSVRGLETWGYTARSAVGAQMKLETLGTNQSAKFSADMTTQIITHDASNNGNVKVVKLVNGSGRTLQDCKDTATNNGTKGNAGLVADLFGDWREEVVLRKADNSALRIYTSTEVTNHKLYTLMHDAQYRAYVACQQTAYNQPSYTSFYFASDADWAYIPVPTIAK